MEIRVKTVTGYYEEEQFINITFDGDEVSFDCDHREFTLTKKDAKKILKAIDLFCEDD